MRCDDGCGRGFLGRRRQPSQSKFPVRLRDGVKSSWWGLDWTMANSQYAYVRDFELPDPLLPETFILFRLDGRSFHRWVENWHLCMVEVQSGIRFSDKHGFVKPNDIRALQLMDHAAKGLMEEYPDIVLAFGESDEYRWVQNVFMSCKFRPLACLVYHHRTEYSTNYLGQLPPPEIDDALQPKTIQNCLHPHILFHLVLCLPLGRVFSGHTTAVSTLLRWQNSPVSISQAYTWLLCMETSW